MPVLVTGTAGFIGNFVALNLLSRGEAVVGIDNLSPYYDVTLKERRLDRLRALPGFTDLRVDLADREATAGAFAAHRPDRVVHLAAQAGVRYSLDHPHAYVDSNISGFLNVLEGCRAVGSRHLVYASTSSVYGINRDLPFSEHHPVDHPISLYAATKRANELMAHCYSHLFDIPATGLRFFTVYGPWGRPDMALFKFARAILAGEPIDVFNEGRMQRDFTYVDDIVDGIVRCLDAIPVPAADDAALTPAASPAAPFRLFNIGNNQPIELMRYIELLEQALGRKADLNLLPMQPGDVAATCADTRELGNAVGYRPSTPVEVGVGRFVEWYLDFYGHGRAA
ncbi:MAG: NAD-dependent epimerase [Rhodospirillaceae bacterium]|nr:NAD-dependent epimerase [Rhodospirillaceae bacterium]